MRKDKKYKLKKARELIEVLGLEEFWSQDLKVEKNVLYIWNRLETGIFGTVIDEGRDSYIMISATNSTTNEEVKFVF